MNKCRGLIVFAYLIVIVLGYPSQSDYDSDSEKVTPPSPFTITPISDYLTTSEYPQHENSSSEIVIDSSEVYLDTLYTEPRGKKYSQSITARPAPSLYTKRVYKPKKTKKSPAIRKKKKERPLTSDFGSFSSTSFENKLPIFSKESSGDEEQDDDSGSDEEEEGYDDFGDFFYDEIEEIAPPVIAAFTKRPPPPYRLEEDQYDDDYYEDDVNYLSGEKYDDSGEDQDMSFTTFFMDLFFEIIGRFAGGGGDGYNDGEEYYDDENNYAARRTTPRGVGNRKGKRPNYNQFLGFFEEGGNEIESKTKEKDPEVVESKWLSWWDDPETQKSVESTTLPMSTSTTDESWGLFNIFSREQKAAATVSPSTTRNPSGTTAANIPALISALSERLSPSVTTIAPPSEQPQPLAQPSTQKSYKNYQLWRLKPINEEHIHTLNGIRLYNQEYQWWQGPTLEGKTDVLVPPNKVDEFREMLSEEEIKYTTTIRDLDMAIGFSNPQIPRSESFHLEAIQGHPMTWHRYHKYADFVKYFEYLHRKYPRNVDLIHIGRTFEGRPIVVCHIYERPPKLEKRNKVKRKKQSIFIESGVRGHEWIGPAVATWILEDLSRNGFRLTNRTLDGVLISREWYILAVANPDGYEYTHTTDRLWTKNRARKKKTSIGFFSNFFSLAWFSKGNADQEDLKADEECLGVDLGRNFDYRWNRDENINSRDSCSRDYAGSRPFSESETRAVARFLIKIAPTLKLYVSLQSYGQMISLPAAKQLPLERYSAVESAESAVNSLRRFGGPPLVKYYVDEDASLRDSVAGSSDGFVIKELEVERAYTMKLRDTGENGFLLPPSYIETTARETFEMIKILVDDLRRRD